MIWLGRYRSLVAIAVAAAIALALFLTFEVWFLVPLPKGPLETWLGY
jgi:putative tricarboxylic transport membrane protein